MKLMSMISKFARSPQGRRYAQQAMDYAKSPEGKRRIDGVRKQLAEGAQALELLRPEEPVAGVGAARGHEADALHVAEHPWRPAGRLRGLVDGQGVHQGRHCSQP